MNRFLRDGKRDKGEEAGSAATNGESAAENAKGSEDNHSGCGIRDEVQAPNVPIKDINLEEFAKANQDVKQEEIKQEITKEKTQSLEINKNKKALKEEDIHNNGRKCKIYDKHSINGNYSFSLELQDI